MIKKRGRFSEEEARYFMAQILTACQHMHLNSVIHRDLKLGNIMLDADMQIKIGDFGLAALLSYPEERKRTVCGTPNYIAPEILYDQGQGHSFEVDIWSVGVILYTLVVGKPPFQTSNVQKIYERIKRNEYEIPPECPVSLQARQLIGAILQPDPSIRPTLIQIMNHPWFTQASVPRALPASSCTTMALLPPMSMAQSQANLLELQQIGRWIPNADDELPEELEDIEMTDAEPAGREDLRSRLGTMVDIENQRAQVNSEAEKAVNPDAPVSTLLKAGQALQKVPPSAAAPSRAPRRPANTMMAGAGAGAGAGTGTSARPPFTARIVDHLSAAMAAYEANAELLLPLHTSALTFSAALGPATEPPEQLEPRPDGTVRRCPPVPSAFILSWLDASDRYGLGYALSNGSIGVHFRDGSTTVLAPSRAAFDYVCPTRRAAASNGTSTPADAESQLASDLLRRKEYPLPRDAQGNVLSEAATDQAASDLRAAASPYLSNDLVNKLEILMYFQAEITDRLCNADHPLLRHASDASLAGLSLPFVHRWFRASTAIVFVFSDDLVQFNFYDHIKVLISNRGAVVGAIIPNEAAGAGTPGGPPVQLLYTWRIDELANITRRDRSQREAGALTAAHATASSRPSAVPFADLVQINITSPEERRAARRVWRKLPVCREVLAKSVGLDV